MYWTNTPNVFKKPLSNEWFFVAYFFTPPIFSPEPGSGETSSHPLPSPEPGSGEGFLIPEFSPTLGIGETPPINLPLLWE